MRKWLIVWAAFAMLFTVNAFAQQGTWSAVNPRPLNFKPVDTSKAMHPKAVGVSGTSALDRFFPKFSLAPWPPRRATSTFPDMSKGGQFHPGLPKGYNPFDPNPKKKK